MIQIPLNNRSMPLRSSLVRLNDIRIICHSHKQILQNSSLNIKRFFAMQPERDRMLSIETHLTRSGLIALLNFSENWTNQQRKDMADA